MKKRIIGMVLLLLTLLPLFVFGSSAENGFTRDFEEYKSNVVVDSVEENNGDSSDTSNSFVGSVGAYKTVAVPYYIDENGSRIIGIHYDAEGNILYKVDDEWLIIVDVHDTTNATTWDALLRLGALVEDIEKCGSVSKLLTEDVLEQLRFSGVEPKKLVVGIMFDVMYYRELKDGETLEFQVKNPAILAMQNSDIYTGKYIIFQKNNETGEFEALNPKDETTFDGGYYTLDGDVMTIRVSHLCEFMVAAETILLPKGMEDDEPADTTAKQEEPGKPVGGECCWWCRIIHCCDHGCECSGFCWCCYWWILIIVLIILIIIIIYLLCRSKEKKNDGDKKDDKNGNEKKETETDIKKE